MISMEKWFYPVGIFLYHILILLLMLQIWGCTSSRPELSLSAYTYDFGILKPDSIYSGSVVVKNIGGDILSIKDVEADCGCTRAFVTKDRLFPDDTCLLSFSFNAYHKRGYQENYIFIEANTDSLVYLLEIHSVVDDPL